MASFWSRVKKPFTLDERSLALFRIILGLTQLVNLAEV